MAQLSFGSFLFGTEFDEKSLRAAIMLRAGHIGGVPADSTVRIRIRKGEFTKAYVRTSAGISEHLITSDFKLGPSMARNIHTVLGYRIARNRKESLAA